MCRQIKAALFALGNIIKNFDGIFFLNFLKKHFFFFFKNFLKQLIQKY